MVRDTSLNAYEQLLGEIGTLQRIIYDYVDNNPNLTALQISQYSGWKINTVTGRINELKQMKLIRENGKVTSEFSDIPSYCYCVNDGEEHKPDIEEEDILSPTKLNNLLKSLSRCNNFQRNKIIKACQVLNNNKKSVIPDEITITSREC